MQTDTLLFSLIQFLLHCVVQKYIEMESQIIVGNYYTHLSSW